jgi:hypothetical protein
MIAGIILFRTIRVYAYAVTLTHLVSRVPLGRQSTVQSLQTDQRDMPSLPAKLRMERRSDKGNSDSCSCSAALSYSWGRPLLPMIAEGQHKR